MPDQSKPGGLPTRIALPIFLVLGGGFIALLLYFLSIGYGVGGSVFGDGKSTTTQQAPQSNNVQGGPPPAVMAQVQTLRARIAAHPEDDIAIAQLGDMYLAAGKYALAIPLYKQALKVNPKNVTAQTGLEQATAGLKAQNS